MALDINAAAAKTEADRVVALPAESELDMVTHQVNHSIEQASGFGQYTGVVNFDGDAGLVNNIRALLLGGGYTVTVLPETAALDPVAGTDGEVSRKVTIDWS